MVLMQPHDLGRKKIVLITGCDSGHGLNVAEHLAFFHRDTHVIATVKDPFSEGATKLYKLQQLNIRVYQLDVTSELDISMMEDRVKRTIEEENGVLWALINNAATFGYANLEGTTPEHMK